MAFDIAAKSERLAAYSATGAMEEIFTKHAAFTDSVVATLLRPLRGAALPAVARTPEELVAGNVALTTGDSLAGLSFGKVQGRELGTVSQYRRLLQLGWPAGTRPFKLADRVLFRLKGDEEPSLPTPRVSPRDH